MVKIYNKYNSGRLALVATLLFGLTGCTDNVELRVPVTQRAVENNRITVKGEICTERPSELEIPTKILFVVDDSDSMVLNDPVDPSQTPETQRERAIEDIWLRERSDQNAEWGIIEFSTLVADQTAGFLPGSVDLRPFIDRIGDNSGNTEIYEAIETATANVKQDILNTDPSLRQRSFYDVYFITDCLPDNGVAGEQERERHDVIVGLMQQEFQNIERLGIGGFRFNAGLVRGQTLRNADAYQRARSLCLDLALNGGGGQYIEFEVDDPNGEIDFADFDNFGTRIQVMNVEKVLVTNRSVLPFKGAEAVLDSDQDGLSDEAEITVHGTNPGQKDTDNDFFSDLVEVLLGLNPLDPTDTECRVGEEIDSDNDDLRDCEEILFGTNPNLFDSDEDGLTDMAELRAGTNPLLNDVIGDIDGDGIDNGAEVQFHSDTEVTTQGSVERLLYSYTVEDGGIQPEGNKCFSYEVNNISLYETPTDAEGNVGVNHIRVEIIQAPLNRTFPTEVQLKKDFTIQYFNGAIQAPSSTLIVEAGAYERVIQ